MAQHPFLQNLLNGQAVEWKTVEEIFHLKNGYTPSKSQKEYWENGTVPWFRMEDIRTNGRILNSAIQKVHESAIKGKVFPANSIMMATTATIGEHALITVDYLSNQQLTNFTIKKEFQNLVDVKFAFYYFFIICEKAKKTVNNSSMPSVQMGELRKWLFPIPPLSVQTKIVQILDTFTAITAELTAELAAELDMRNKQYQYYRDKLLSENELAKVGFEWKSLGEVGEFIRGKRFVKTDIIEFGTPCIHYGEIYTHYDIWADKTRSYISPELAKNLRFARKNDVIIVSAGETVEDIGKGVAWLGEEPVVVHDACFVFRSEINPKYVSYFLRTKSFHDQIKKHISYGKIASINSQGLSKAIIPIPPLAEQARIVAILDKFDTLTQSISDGLPREIELRQQQYEYYREALLSF